MIVLSAKEYKEKLGPAWEPGMLIELIRFLRVNSQQVWCSPSNVLSDIAEISTNNGWNLAHVVALVGPRTIAEAESYLQDNNQEINSNIDEYVKTLKMGILPVIVFIAPQIKDEDQLIQLTNKLIKLKAFL
jgi:hypothetical protein